MKTIMDRLQDLALLKRDWNSYGARRIDTEAIKRAESILKTLEKDNIQRPHFVGPMSDGGVSFQWTNLEISIPATGKIGWYNDYFVAGDEEGGEIEIEKLDTLYELMG